LKHVDLLGTELKSDFFCDLLETYAVKVVYEYDRTHENMPDRYLAEIPELGLQLVFDERQRLYTLFANLVEIKTFCPISPLSQSTPLFDSKELAQTYAEDKSITFTEGSAEFLGEQKDWIRFELADHSVHYEFVKSTLRMITFQVRVTA